MNQKQTNNISTSDNVVMVRISHFVRRVGMAAMVLTIAMAGINGFAAVPTPTKCGDTSILSYLKAAGGAWGKNCSDGVPTPVGAIVGGVIQAFLGFLGIIFLVLTIYAGYLWMTAEGDKAKVQKAEDLLKSAVIGLVIIIVAQGITYWVLATLAKTVAGTTT